MVDVLKQAVEELQTEKGRDRDQQNSGETKYAAKGAHAAQPKTSIAFVTSLPLVFSLSPFSLSFVAWP